MCVSVRVCVCARVDSTMLWGPEALFCFSLWPVEEQRDALFPASLRRGVTHCREAAVLCVAKEVAGVLRAAAGADGSAEAVGRGLETVRAWAPWTHLHSHGSHLTSCHISYP